MLREILENTKKQIIFTGSKSQTGKVMDALSDWNDNNGSAGMWGGNDGGDIIAYGSVRDLLESNRGYTQQYLREFVGGE